MLKLLIFSHRTDSEDELLLIQRLCKEEGAFDAVVCSHWAHGSKGAADLAEAVEKAAQQPNNFQFLYELEQSIEDKIEVIAKEIYGAAAIELSPEAKEQIDRYKAQVKFTIISNELLYTNANFIFFLIGIQ